MVFSSFANLHKLLSDADQQLLSQTGSITESQQQLKSLSLDSRVISAAFLKKNHQNSGKSQMVKIMFQHLSRPRSENVQRFCVFWDLRDENWSDDGCKIIKTNATHTECSCNHLTHFALLAPFDSHDSALVGNGLDFGRIQAKDQTKEAQKDTSTVITLEIATYLVASVCMLILVIILVQVSIFFSLFLRF